MNVSECVSVHECEYEHESVKVRMSVSKYEGV
jgi:hypothetical protein